MNFVKRLLYVGFILLTAIGCKVGQNYVRPDVGNLEEYYGNYTRLDSVNIDESNLADTNWRDYFKDSILISLIDSALVNNLDMLREAKRVEIGEEVFRQSRANFYPSLGLSPFDFTREYYSEDFNNFGSNRARRNHPDNIPTSLYTERLAYSGGLFSSWEIDLWGKLRRQKEAAKAGFAQSQEFQKAVQTAIVAEVASTYYNMLLTNSQIAIAEKNFELGKNTLSIVKLQFEADETTSLAVRQTESQTLRAESLIPQLERFYAVLENRLNQLLGRYPGPIATKEDLDDVVFDNRFVTGVPLELIANRPDVAAAEYQLIASNAQVGVTQAMRYPSLTLGGGLGVNTIDTKTFFDPLSSGFALINGALFQPIFQNRKLKTDYKVSVAEREIAQLDFKDNVILAVREVSDALVTIEKLQEEYRIGQRRIVVTGRGVRDALLLFQSDFANYLEVINAQEDALQSELELADVKRQHILANIELYRSLGGGWK